MKPWPVVISIPHGGMLVPDEIKDRVRMGEAEIREDIDAYSVEIYDIGNRALDVIVAEVGRPFVDLNRAPDDRPPANADGVVKTLTCLERTVYKEGQNLDDDLADRLIRAYHEPYHERIRWMVERPGLVIGLDCHTMAAVGPPNARDSGRRRPAICLGHNGGGSCDEETVGRLAGCFRDVWSLDADEVTIDRPFRGGYITRTYGRRPVPWIQIEISRALYLVEPWFDRSTQQMDRNRLKELNELFAEALDGFFS